MLKEAEQLCKKHEEDFKFSPYFWHYTVQAYYETALIRLHRIYDQNKESFNLHRLLITVRDNKQIFDVTEVRKRRAADPHVDELIRGIGPFDLSQLDRDIEFSSEVNPRWRILNIGATVSHSIRTKENYSDKNHLNKNTRYHWQTLMHSFQKLIGFLTATPNILIPLNTVWAVRSGKICTMFLKHCPIILTPFRGVLKKPPLRLLV
jgi:AbiU2